MGNSEPVEPDKDSVSSQYIIGIGPDTNVLITDQMILRARRSTGEEEELEELFSEDEKGVHMSIAPGYPLAGREGLL